MSREPEPMFLARETYRRRRLMDAGKMMPILGAILFFAPALWAGQLSTLTGLLYLLLCWIAMIVAAVLLSRRLPTQDTGPGPGDEEGR